jgi:hypothetical protein
MSYIVRARFTKTDDNPWVLGQPEGQELFDRLADSELGTLAKELMHSLRQLNPSSLHEAIWEIPARDENHAQQILIELISWQHQHNLPVITQLANLIFRTHPTWVESMTVDAV